MTTQPTIYTYFRGGGGADLGAEQAGYRSIGGVEFDAQIAAVCDRNFPNAPTTIADVCDVDPAMLLDTAPTWFHASPSCKNASQAKAAEIDEDGAAMPRETEQDRACGAAVARFITHWTPALVTIENVWQYRTFEAFERIREALREAGYSYEYWHLNAADYGVPQTRKRLILKARKGLCYVQRPSPTHRQGGDMFHAAWRGWYEAIEDLIPTLPESKFADWQLKRLPDGMTSSLVDCTHRTDGDLTVRGLTEPAHTIASSHFRRPANEPRAFIVGNNDPEWGEAYKYGDQPMMSLTTQTGTRARAFLVRDDNTKQAWGKGYKEADEPAMTTRPDSSPRAFLVGEDSKMGVVQADEPAMTRVSSPRSGNTRAWLSAGRVVKMTPRALARFQSVPDGYALPERASLACTVIGNMIPPLLMERVIE